MNVKKVDTRAAEYARMLETGVLDPREISLIANGEPALQRALFAELERMRERLEEEERLAALEQAEELETATPARKVNAKPTARSKARKDETPKWSDRQSRAEGNVVFVEFRRNDRRQ